jgi:Cu-processing system permease protein
LNDALRNRWFVLYTLAFIGLALGLSYMSLAGAGIAGFAGFGRTAASLINLVLLIIPLMALTVGAQSLAHEQEQGTLAYLLAQPVTRVEVFTGQVSGAGAELAGVAGVGFWHCRRGAGAGERHRDRRLPTSAWWCRPFCSA